MTNSDFDKKIQDVFAEAEMSFSEDNWARMQQRLDKKSPRKLLLLPLLYKPYAAAALIGVAASLYFFTRDTHQPRTASISPMPPVAHTAAPVNNPVDTLAGQNKNFQPAVIVTPQSRLTTIPVVTEQAREIFVAANDTITPATEEITPPKHSLAINKYENSSHFLQDYEDGAHKRKITFGVNTGMAIYESQNSFAGGLVVKSHITSRIALHAGVGFVQNRQSASVKHTIITERPVITPSDTSVGITTIRTETEYYEQYSKNLPFIQFNPALSILVVKRLTGTVGADVQRILISNNMLDTINKHLAAEGKKVAGIDAGLTVSVNYNVTKNIGLGLSYRNSLMGVSASHLQHIKRNYFLVQLQYIFNAQ